MNLKEFIEELEKLNITLEEKQKEQLEQYYELLILWNQRINLTGITDKEEVYLKHFYDSLTICKIIDLTEQESLCDIGTGAGFPGLVLKIVFPHLKITLLDSLHKRTNFLEEVKKQLNLKEVTILCDRAEIYAKNHKNLFDVVTSRAVSKLPVLLEYSIPLVKIGGYFVPMKGNIEEEMKGIEKIEQKLKIKLLETKSFLLPKENSVRTLLKFQKKEDTPLKYPREYKEIKKHPLS